MQLLTSRFGIRINYALFGVLLLRIDLVVNQLVRWNCGGEPLYIDRSKLLDVEWRTFLVYLVDCTY